jgi:hypothetical protein
MPWPPTIIRYRIKGFQTAAETVLVSTDAGEGYLKAMGNRGGPHRLAADWVGTQLAAWLGLPTFDFAIIQVLPENEIPFYHGGQAQSGPAFITRADPGMTWGGDAATLAKLVNPEDIGKLVLFDTWVRNVDRYPPNLANRKPNRGNVFLSSENVPDGQWRLLAMDHTHCFDGPGYLDAKLDKIDFVQDDLVYGLFPEFIPFLRPHWPALEAAVAHLKTMNQAWIQQITAQIPNEWQVEPAARAALAKQVYSRADFLSENFIPELEAKLLA